MKGWRTVFFNVAAAVLPVLEGLDLTAVLSPQGLAVYAVLVSVGNVALRTITTTAIGKK